MPTYTLNNVNYTYTVGTVAASVGTSSTASGNITVLSSFVVSGATYNVTSIGTSAFFNNRLVTSITLPDSILSISNEAFSLCTVLVSINIPNGITIINPSTFNNCSSLASITIPNSVTSIGLNAFYGCSRFTSITLPNALTSIAGDAFTQCTGLTSIEFPASLTSVASNAFGSNYIRSYVIKSLSIASNIRNIITQRVGLSLTFDYVGGIPDSMLSGIATLSNLTIGPNITDISGSAFLNCSGLTTVVIPPSVKSIGITAFKGCSKLSSITVPNSVTSIGASAFSNCSELTSFTFPSNVTSISNTIFSYCYKLSSVSIPSTVTSIGSGAFSNCYLLKNITIPNSLTSLGASAFYYCSSLENVTIPASITSIGIDVFSECTSIANIVIKSISGISIFNSINKSFYFSVTFDYAGVISDSLNANIVSLTNVTFGPSITKIGISSFQNCKYLRTVTIPDSVTIIENNAFYGCDRLQTVTINNSSSLTKIGNSAFYGCSQLNSINIPSSITTIGTSAFYNCISMVSCTTSQSGTLLLSIPNSVFYNCTSLQSFTIPPSVTSIDYSLFQNCSSLATVTIPPSVTTIAGSTFFNCSSLISVTLPNITIINSSLFNGCNSLTSVNIPTTVTTIEYTAFLNCSSLTSLTIPTSVSLIRTDSFKNCTGLTSITVASNNATYSSENGVLFNKAKTTLMVYPPASLSSSYVIPSTVGTVSANAFCKCVNLTSLTIPNSTTNIQSLSFFGFPMLSTIVINSTHTGFLYENGVLFNKAKTTLMLYTSGLSNTSYAVPSTVTTIFNAAFYGATNLTSVTIPNSVTVINDFVFYGCIGLTSVNIPSNATYIAPSAFYGCSSLTSVTFPSTLHTISTNAFYGCSSLTTFTFPPLVTILESDVFNGCSSLTSVTIPSTLTNITGNPFRNCNNLSSINVASTNAGLLSENGVLFNKDKTTLILCPPKSLIQSFVFPSTVRFVNSYAFSQCQNLRTVMIPRVITINDSTFHNCSNLLNVIFTGLVSTINGTNFSATGDTVVYDSFKNPNNVLNQLSMFTSQINQKTPILTNFTFPSYKFSSAPLMITPPTSDVSGGVLTYVSTDTSIATVSGNTLTMITTANGTSNIRASQTFTNIYGDLSFTTFSVIDGNTLYISQGVPSLSFSIPSKKVGDASFTLIPPTTNSNGTFTYTSSNTAVATVNNAGLITVKIAGVTTITATQAATTKFVSKTIATVFAVNALSATVSPTITNFSVPARLPQSAPFDLVAPTSDSSGAFTYTSSNVSVATVTGTYVSIIGEGSSTFTATQAGNSTYKSGSVTSAFIVSLTQPTVLSNFVVPAKTFGDASFNITQPTTNGDGVITYTSSDTSVATIAGNVITIVGAGASTITANQAETSIFMAATIASVLTVNKATPTLTNFSIPAKTAIDASFSLVAPTSNSSGEFTYTSSDTAVATIVGSLVTIVGVGTSTITAVQTTTTNYLSGSTTADLVVTQGILVLTNFSVPVKSVGDVDFTLVPPTTTSTGLITYTSSDTSVATITGNVVTVVGVGTSTITADQASTANYTSATIAATLTVLSAPTITDFSVPAKTFGDVSFSIVAPTTNSDGLITYTSSNAAVATVAGSTITIVGAGTAIITASQAFTASYGPGSITATLTVSQATTVLTDFSVPTKTFGDASFNITPPTTNSNGTFTYTSSDTTVATVSGSIITIIGAGTSTITAVQASNTNFVTETIPATLTVSQATPTITNFVVPAKVVGDASFSLITPTSNSSGSFTYTSSDTSVATIDGDGVTVVGIGSSTITATQASTANYVSGTITSTLIVRFTSALTNFSVPAKTFGDVSFSIVAPTTESDGAFTYTSSNTAVATISGEVITIVGAGSSTITAVQANTTTYASGTITASLVVSKATTVLSNFSVPAKTFGNAAFAITAPTTNGNGAFTYTSSNTAVATVAGSTITIVGVGTSTITASQATTTNFLAATTTATLTVSQATTVLSNFVVPTKIIGNAAFSITAPTTNGNGAFTYTSSNTAVATIAGNVVTIVGVGSCTITADQASTTNYTAGSITANFLVNQITTVLSGFSVAAKQFADASFNLVAPTTNSPGAFTYTSSNTAVATIAGTTVTVVGVGSATITASQASTTNYTTGTTTATLTVSKATTVLTNLSVGTKTFGDLSFNIVTPTTNSDGVITYTSSNTAVATVSGSTITIVGAGTSTITASQATTTNYLAGTTTATLTVNKATTVLTNFSVPLKIIGNAPFSITAPTTNSNGAFTYTSSNTAIATIAGSTITIVGIGTSTITASQATTTNFSAATTTAVFQVNNKTPLITDFVVPSTKTFGDAAFILVDPSSNSTGAFNYKSSNTSVATIVGNIVTIVGAGTSIITATQAVTDDYISGTITATLTVSQATTSVIYNTLSNIVYTTPLASKLTATASPSISGLMKYYVNSSQVYSSTVLTTGTYTISATFTPTSSNYTSSTTTQSLTVDKKSSTIAFPTVSTIVYETTLADFISKTSTGIGGTYSYYLTEASAQVSLTSNTVLNVGNYTINVDFTPTDLINYLPSTSSTNLSVSQKTVNVIYSNLSAITYGQTLSSSLTATMSNQTVDGSLNYYLDNAKTTQVTSETTLAVGSYTLYAFFTPTSSNYMSSQANTSLVVNKLTPTLTFSTIQSITYGTTLATFISETTTSVAGTFNFNLADSTQLTSSTTLNIGSYIIFCTFTPSNSESYLSSTDAKVLTVIKGEDDLYANDLFDVTKVMDTMSLWIDAKSSTKFDYDQGKQSWSDRDTMVATHVAAGQGADCGLVYSYDGINWITSSKIFDNNANCVATNGSIWLAGGNSGIFYYGLNVASSTAYRMAYSFDGINWTGVNASSLALMGQIKGFAYGKNGSNNAMWVAVGASGLATSFDGVNWTGRTYTLSSGNAVSWNGSMWVSVGSTPNTITTSANGINWSGLGATIFSTAGNGIACNGSMWVAVGQGTNTIAYSYNGTTWSGITTSPFSVGYGVAWNGWMWVAVGQGTNTIAYSYDGIAWIGVTGYTMFSTYGMSIAWNGSLWIAGGQGTNTMATSTDGITWTARGSSALSTAVYGVCGYKTTNEITLNATLSKYLFTGAGTNSLGFIQNSTTPIAGLNRLRTFTTQGNAIFHNSNKWVAVGQGGNTIATSNDGLVWTGQGATTFTTAGNDVICDGTTWIAVGQGGNTVATSSDNGATWSGQTLSYFSSGTSILYAVPATPTASTTTYNASLASSTVTVATPSYIATGVGTTASLAVSTDAITWTPIGVISGGYGTRVFTTRANYVYGAAGSYVAVGAGGNTIATSSDGINWTGSGSTVFTTSGNGVYTNGSLWVAVGEGGNTIATSTDRITWTGLGATIFTTRGNRVVWNADLNLWIATGQGGNTVATSTNGTTWIGRGTTIFSAAGYGIASSGPVGSTTLGMGTVVQKTTDNKLFFYVSVGQGGNTISYSPDGKQWFGAGATRFTTKGNKIAHNGTMYVAVGQGGNTIAYSYEGMNFTGSGASVFTTAGYGIAYNSYMWVATGQGGNTIATSTNGTTWVGRSAFSTAGYNVTWANNQWVAVGEGGNTISSSIDGITWTGREASVIFTKARGIAYGANRWIAVGEGANTIATSVDGITWTGLGSTTFTVVGNNVAWNGSRFVAVGQGGNTVATSVDGTIWSAVTGTRFANYGSDIKWLHNNWVAAGSDASHNYLGSVDGLIWTGIGKGTYTTEAVGVGGYAFVNKTRYATVGNSQISQMCTSYDGINWIHRISNAAYQGVVVAFGKDSSGNDLWVVCSNTITTSLNGFNSYVMRHNGMAAAALYGGNTWVAVGNDQAIVSSNGFITKTTVFTQINNTSVIGWNGTYWVVGGSGGNTFATSTDNGATWIGRGSTSLMTVCSCIVWGNGLWVAGGYANGASGIVTSSDGITWTGRSAGVADNVKCIGWNGSIFVAGCLSASGFRIITSTDGVVWTGRSTSIIGNTTLNVVWDGSKWIMMSNGSPSFAYSVDGINWVSKTTTALHASFATSLGKIQSANDTYPVIVKVYDKSSQNNNSTFMWEDIRTNFTTTRVLRENLINGYPAMQLVQSGFTNPYSPGHSGNTFTFFTVIKFNMMFGSPRFLSFGPGSSTNDASLNTAFILSGAQTSATNYSLSLWRNNVQFPISSVVLGTPYLISAYFTGSSVNVGINGVYTTFECSGDFNIQKVGVGINTFDNSGSTHATDYGEVMTFTTVPTSVQRLTIEGYLAHKWGLLASLPESHPYKTIAEKLTPIFIPQSNNSGYARRIVETFPMSYYPVLETGSKLGNYSSLEQYKDGTFSGQPTYDANIIQDMSLYYNFNEEPGSNYATGAYVADASLSSTGSVSTTTYKFGTASLVLSATSSLTLQPVSVYPLGTSFSFWLKSNASANNSYVFVLRNNSDLNQQSIYFNISSNTYSLNVVNSSASSSALVGTANINSNAWVHFVWTLDPNGNWRTYINNVLTDNLTGRLYPSVGSRNTCNLGTGAFTDAYLDEFMMFNRVLTAAEVSTLFVGTPIYLGTNSITTSTSDTKFGTMSLGFPGTSHTGTVALNPVTFSEGNAMTLSAWVKFASLDAVPRTIISLTNSTDSIRLAASSTNYLLYRGDLSFNVPVTPATNTWTHVVANNTNIGTNAWTVTVNKNKNTKTLATSSVVTTFVAGGTGGNALAYSSDGINWTGVGSNIFSVFSTHCIAIAYGNNMLVAGGQGGNTIATSTDGINWTGRGATPFDSIVSDVAYGNGIWVAVGQNSSVTTTIATSTDGITWTSRTGTTIFNNGWGVVFGNNQFVAVGGGANTFATSPDGINWTGRGGSTIFSSHPNKVAYGNGLYVAVAEGTTSIATSTDGITWTGRGAVFPHTAIGIAYGNGLWVTCGGYNGNTIATSTDGITWTGRSNIFAPQAFGVTYANGLWVACGQGANTLATSTDGITWTGRGNTVFASYAWGIASNFSLTGAFYPSSNPGNNVYTKTAIGMDVSSNNAKMDGFIDDVRVFNSSLSVAQISQLYDGRLDLNALTSHYTFDSVKGNTSIPNFASGSVVYDASITNMDLHTTVGNRLGVGCLNFYSTNYAGIVTLGPVDLRADPSNATFSTWVKFSSLDTVPRTVFSFGQNNCFITLTATYNNYTFTYKSASSTSFINVIGTNLNTWNHVAIKVTNAASNSWIFYLNGVKTSFLVDSSSALALPTVDFANVYTSNYLGVDASVNKMHGYVDDTRIYNKGLTDAEVLNVFNTDVIFSVETIKVDKSTSTLSLPIITMSSINSIVYGTTMSSFINGTTVSADGTLSFYANSALLTVSSVLTAGTYTIYCSFTPADPLSFQSITTTKTITVQKLSTIVRLSSTSTNDFDTSPLISTIAYGTSLSAFMSQFTTTVSGTKTFYINDTSGQQLTASSILNVGVYTIYCKFDPTDSTNYSSSFKTTQLTVTQTQIIITYGPLSSVTYGTTLISRMSASIVPSVDGSMNYYINSVKVSSTTVLDASSHVITATFTPVSSNYIEASTTATLVVNKASTNVTFPVLQSVFFNAPIGTASLCATVAPDISGTMSYFTNSTFTNEVLSSTTLTQGIYTLYARFTPTSTNYSVSSASSSLTVIGQTAPTITFPAVTAVDAYTTLESFINGTTTGVDGTFVFNKINITGAILTPTSIFNVLGSFVIFCRFTPTNTVLYMPSSATYTLNVKYSPTFFFNQRPSSTVSYGTNLSGTALSTTVNQFNNTNIPGTVTFSNGITTSSLLTPGIYTVIATFTPTNLDNYRVVTASKQIIVTKQPLTVNITSPSVKAAFINSAPIDCSYQVWGILTALGDTFANSVTGTITNKYLSFDGTTVLTSAYVYNTTFSGSSQTYKIAADISGFSSTKYEFTSQSYTFTINKYTPTLSYTISAPNKTLTYGTKLGANQLNAVVSYNGTPITTGSIVYTRSLINMDLSVNSQTVLDIGQYNLYAYYSDLSNNVYNSVNTSMITTNQITIAKATPVIVFPNIQSILTGTNLSNILNFIDATFNSDIIAGTFVFSYVNQSGATVIVNSSTVLTKPPSIYTINASFTPTNSSRYNNSTGSITIGLSDLNSTLSTTPLLQTPFIYGKTFNDLYKVNVSPSISGTYTYYDGVNVFNPAITLDAGHHSYTIIFNPSSNSYVSSIVDVSFTIEKADVTLSYLTPPSYAYQIANQLSLLQPVKSVAVDGDLKIFLDSSFTTELTNATPMTIGTYTLYVRFTSVKNYNVATTTTTLTVTKIPSILAYTTNASTIAYGATVAALLNNSAVGSIGGGSMQYYYDSSFTQIVNSADILNYGTYTIYNRFVPTSSIYATSYATQTIKVNKAVLSIVYPTLPSIVYGTTLQSSFTASTLFDGSINYFIDGTQVFANTQLDSGSHTITAIFTATTSTNFTTPSVSTTRTLTVIKQSTAITYFPTNVTSDTAFEPNMTASVAPNIPGTMRYFINNQEVLSSTVMSGGNYTMFVTFTPTDSTNYNSSSISVPLAVISSQQLLIITENVQQIQNATNNQIVSIVSQNALLPPTLDVKVNVLTAGQTSFTSPATSSVITGITFNFLDGSISPNVKIALSALTVDLPNASNSPAIYFKFYDETGNSIVSADNKVSLVLKLPLYKGLTQNLYLLRMQDVGTEFDGTQIPLIPVDPANPQNVDFTAIFTSNSVYVGSVIEPSTSIGDPLLSNMYAFEATGGFVMQRGFDDIKAREFSAVETFDVTDSVQVLFDVALFNSKLGLNKNADNNQILSSTFNSITDRFENNGSAINTVTFSASEFIDGVIKKQQIISVGKYSTVYSDFRNYVANYFGFDGGFSSLFTAASEFAIDTDNHFDSESMMQLFASVSSNGSSAYINQMTGSISVSNITSSLRYCIDSNCFGNRTPIADPSQNATGSAVDPVDKNNYGVEDGFVAGDLIWIPTGTQLNLNLNIDVESFMPLNNVGPENISSSQTTNYISGNFSRDTTATTTNIHRTVRAPLLLKLVNGSTINSL
jgi:hypothetical protein